ncbi:hypothetical protein B0H10DRAFT_2187885 [Mycena sp. CBHHK59/15]|nr:hypothetical protein B0H10DRAFT_2187885 [Mycena sp. CBHHK59/15]
MDATTSQAMIPVNPGLVQALSLSFEGIWPSVLRRPGNKANESVGKAACVGAEVGGQSWSSGGWEEGQSCVNQPSLRPQGPAAVVGLNFRYSKKFLSQNNQAWQLPTLLAAAKPRCGNHKRATGKLTESLAAEKADDDGNAFVAHPKHSHAKAPHIKAVPESVSDQEDSDFELPDLVDPSNSEGSDDEMDVDNTELASILPSKTIPARSKVTNLKTRTRAVAVPSAKRKQTSESASAPATKKLNRQATVEETSSPVNAAGNRNDRATVEAEDDSPARPVVNSVGYSGAPGDKHYKCYHGNRQIIMILRASRSNLSKLIRHLKNNFPIVHRLYCALHTQAQPPTEEQLKLAQGAIPVDGDAAKEYLGKIEMAASSIIKGLEQQAKKAKLLEAIGVISKSDKKKAEGRSVSYQDTVTAPLSRKNDDDTDFDEEEEEEGNEATAAPQLKAVTKV